MPSRRAMLAALATTPVAGCLDSSSTAVPSGTEEASDSPTPSPAPDCDGATIDPQGVSPEGFEPEGETVTLFEDYLRVRVEATAQNVPDLRGRIESCEGTEEVRRSVPGTGGYEFEFGPYGHHCVQEYDFWLAGCR